MNMRIPLAKIPAMLFLALTFFINPAYSIDFWVTKNGNDDNTCTSEQNDACLTIQKAISLAIAGDTINITPGTNHRRLCHQPLC